MQAAHENFLARGLWPGGNGWGREPADVVTPADLGRLDATIRAMVAAGDK